MYTLNVLRALGKIYRSHPQLQFDEATVPLGFWSQVQCKLQDSVTDEDIEDGQGLC